MMTVGSIYLYNVKQLQLCSQTCEGYNCEGTRGEEPRGETLTKFLIVIVEEMLLALPDDSYCNQCTTSNKNVLT